MSKKTRIIICAALIILVLVAVYVIFIAGRSAEQPQETPAETPAAEVQNETPAEEVKPAEPTPEQEKAEESVQESAQLIESDGDITIIIPEDEESDGF